MPNKSGGNNPGSPLDHARETVKALLSRAKKGGLITPAEVAKKAAAFTQKEAATLSARAYLEIRNKILKGDLPIGMALSRRQLATELNISVPPVTEALQQ